MRRFEQLIRHQDDLGFTFGFETLHPIAFFVQQIGCNFYRQLCDNLCGAFLASFFADNAQNGERQRFNASDIADAGATRAGQVAGFTQRWTQPLPGHFQQTETRDLAELHPGPILPY